MFRTIRFLFKIILLFLLVFFRKHITVDNLSLPDFISPSFLKSLVYFLIFWLSVNIVIRIIQFFYRKKKKYGDKYSDNIIVGLHNIYYIVSITGLAITLLGFAGIELKELVTALSILAASIAIITKEIALDIICGMQLSFSKDLAIGDYVKIGEQKGKVLDINITKIILQNENDDIIYLPNSKAYYSELINYTQKELRKYNVDFSVPPQLSISLEQLKNIVDQVLSDYTEYLDDEQFNLKITGINKDEIRYKIQFKLNQINPKMSNEIKSKIMDIIITKLHGGA
ncbi:MAG: mechanosensitive ion channel family protein [Saprospiraceae bacterium]|nr:mechanosensitive ion channel family protein [Saprospiraceae bacterium]